MNSPQTNQGFLYGKLPAQSGFIDAGERGPAEQLFEVWLQHAVRNARGTHPRRAVRFIMAPQAVPIVGVSIASRDREGRAFPLALLRRLPTHTRDVPWTLLLGLYASYLAAAESCLWLGQHVPLPQLREICAALELPHPSTIAGTLHDASSGLSIERVHAFAERNLHAPARDDGIERLIADALRTLRHATEAPSPIPTLELPAQEEFDLYVWLELLRAQLDSMDKPRALFWCPGEQRALIDLGDPSPHTFSYLAEPCERSPACRLPGVAITNEQRAAEDSQAAASRSHGRAGSIEGRTYPATRLADAPIAGLDGNPKPSDRPLSGRSAGRSVGRSVDRSTITLALDPQVARLIERDASLAELAGALAVAG